MLDDLFNFPLHRVERMIGAVHDAVGPRPYDRFAEKGQPADAGAVHVDIVILLCDLHHLPDAFDQPRMAHDDGELAEISGHFAKPLRTCILPQAAVKENDQAVVLSRLHEWIDLFFIVGRAIFDQRMNLYPFESELDPFLQNLERILWAVSGTQPHEAVNASRVLFHSAGNVLVGLSIIRRLPYPDGKSDNPIYPGAIHRAQHVLRHEFHDRGNLVDGKLLSRPHVGVRVNDFDAFSFNGNHGRLLRTFCRDYPIENLPSTRSPLIVKKCGSSGLPSLHSLPSPRCARNLKLQISNLESEICHLKSRRARPQPHPRSPRSLRAPPSMFRSGSPLSLLLMRERSVPKPGRRPILELLESTEPNK